MCACKRHSNPFADCTCNCDHDKLVADLLKPLLKNYTGKAIIKAFPQHVWDELENMYRLKPKNCFGEEKDTFSDKEEELKGPFEEQVEKGYWVKDESSLIDYAEPFLRVTACQTDCTSYRLNEPCVNCGHASALHPGVHNPGLDVCAVCEARKQGRDQGYPQEDGDVIVLGPEVFIDKNQEVISYKGENYYLGSDLNKEQNARAAALHQAKGAGASSLSLITVARWIYEGKQPKDR